MPQNNPTDSEYHSKATGPFCTREMIAKLEMTLSTILQIYDKQEGQLALHRSIELLSQRNDVSHKI